MTDQVVYVRASKREAVIAALRTLPGVLANSSDPLAVGFRNGLGFGLLQKIDDNFVANSETGGSPDVDLHWPPLAPSTIQKRLHGTRHRSRSTQRAREENLSDTAKKEIRKKVNALKRLYIEDGMEPASALGLARAQVYGEYRAAGDKIPTSREMVSILRDTGIGLNAMSPVSFDEGTGSYQPPTAGTNPETGEPVDPIWENGAGEIVVGVRGYMARHHTGDPAAHLPQRRLWPDPNEFPMEWWNHIEDVSQTMLANVAAELARRAA